MTTTEIAVRQPHDTDSWVAMLPAVGELAEAVGRTEFVPGPLRGHVPAVAAAILAGREIGLPPMQSLQHIHVIDGRPTLSAQMQRSLALAAGYHISIVETTTTRCVVEGRRSASDDWTRVTWTVDDAKRASLLGRANWQKHPRRMLQARATAELCQLIFSDAVAGMAATEEAEDDAEGPGAVRMNGSEPPVPRTAQRRQRAADKPPAETPSNPVAKREDPATGLPPLPGEDEPDPTTSGASSSAHAPDNESRQRNAAPSPSSPGNSEPGQPPPIDPDAHGTATRGKGGQLTALWTILSTEFGFAADQKDQARTVVEHILGRQLDGGTTGDCSYNEAKLVLDTLSNWITVARERGEPPHSVLIAAMIAADQAGSDGI